MGNSSSSSYLSFSWLFLCFSSWAFALVDCQRMQLTFSVEKSSQHRAFVNRCAPCLPADFPWKHMDYEMKVIARLNWVPEPSMERKRRLLGERTAHVCSLVTAFLMSFHHRIPFPPRTNTTTTSVCDVADLDRKSDGRHQERTAPDHRGKEHFRAAVTVLKEKRSVWKRGTVRAYVHAWLPQSETQKSMGRIRHSSTQVDCRWAPETGRTFSRKFFITKFNLEDLTHDHLNSFVTFDIGLHLS